MAAALTQPKQSTAKRRRLEGLLGSQEPSEESDEQSDRKAAAV